MIFDLLAAPLTALTWIAEQVHDRVIDEIDQKTVLSRELLNLQMAFDLGAIDEASFEIREETILLALQAIEDDENEQS
jgi:hypothetical protein